MNSNNKDSNKKKLVIAVLVTISLLIWAITALKIIQHKSIIIIDNEINECYDNCNNLEDTRLALDDSSIVTEIQNNKLANYKENLAERKIIVANKLAAELEAKRIAKQKAKEEEKKKQVIVSRGKQLNDNWIAYEATHYSAFCNTGCTGTTAYGYDVKNTIYEQGYRVIAVDPKKIKLGSLVEVKTSYGTFKALAGDTGGNIKGFRIDILVESDKVAYSLGREKVQVRVLK
ncbi:3D domain-containing protein [Bacillus sp. FJAT-22090]|uniref:3D domain-containing protein n=1 Tax=Bacillus sp. FJAT-22090 TaxID=1581038 RepID=UPI0016433D2A|nr:3D domain-containing protein [Bacillus sp. FJAT-22090]